jgi:hypothetical protein
LENVEKRRHYGFVSSKLTFFFLAVLALFTSQLKGLPAPVVGAMAENAVLFFTYDELQNAIRWISGKRPSQDLTWSQLALAAGGAGTATSFVLFVLFFISQMCGV